MLTATPHVVPALASTKAAADMAVVDVGTMRADEVATVADEETMRDVAAIEEVGMVEGRLAETA